MEACSNTVPQRLAALRSSTSGVEARMERCRDTVSEEGIPSSRGLLSQQEVARLIDATETPVERILLMTAPVPSGARRAGELARPLVEGCPVADRQPTDGGSHPRSRQRAQGPGCDAESGAAGKRCELTGAGFGTSRAVAVSRQPVAYVEPPVTTKVLWTACQRAALRKPGASTSIRIPCATASRRICSKQASPHVPLPARPSERS